MDFSVTNSSAGVDYNTTAKVQAHTTSAENTTVKTAETVIKKYTASDPVKKSSLKNDNTAVNADTEETDSKEPQADEKVVSKAVEEANRNLKGFRRSFEYNVDELTDRIIIKVIDSETDEVIKEIPPEKSNDAVRKMWELAGLIVDKKI